MLAGPHQALSRTVVHTGFGEVWWAALSLAENADGAPKLSQTGRPTQVAEAKVAE
jgi:hypothetical protein